MMWSREETREYKFREEKLTLHYDLGSDETVAHIRGETVIKYVIQMTGILVFVE